MQEGRVIHNIINGVQRSKSISASRSGMVPPVKQIATKMRQLLFLPPVCSHPIHHAGPSVYLQVCRALAAQGTDIARAVLLGPRAAGFPSHGNVSGAACSAGANFKPLGSPTAGGTLGRLPRAASTERPPRAGQVPPDSVHASRSRGAWRGDSGRARGALGVRSPECSERLGGRNRLGAKRRQRTSSEEAGRFQINPIILG